MVCGHIHRVEMRQIEGILYCNTGDWVESCTALVEGADGALELLCIEKCTQARCEIHPWAMSMPQASRAQG